MFVVPRPRMLVERVQFTLWEQSAVGRRMIAEAEPKQLSGSGHPGMQALMTSWRWTSSSPSCIWLAAWRAANGATWGVVWHRSGLCSGRQLWLYYILFKVLPWLVIGMVKFLSLFWLAAKGRTNMEMREQFSLRPGTSQVMSHFRSKTPSKSYGELPDMHAWNRTASPTSAPVVKVMNRYQWSSVFTRYFSLKFTFALLLFQLMTETEIGLHCGVMK